MSTTISPEDKNTTPLSDATLAFLLLRLFLAIRWIHAFMGKIMTEEGTLSLGNLQGLTQYMSSAFENKLPLFMVIPYARIIPWVELILGIALLTGFRTRNTLVLSGLTFISLAFGQLMLKNYDTVADIGFHLALVVAALLLLKHNRFRVMD